MSIRKQSLWGIFIKACNILMGFLVVVVLTRALSLEEYGAYSVVLATVLVLTAPTLGLPNYVVREVAKSMSDGDGTKVRRIARVATLLALSVSALLMIVAAGWVYFRDDGSLYRSTMWLGLSLVPMIALSQVLGAALRGIGHSGFGLLLSLVLRPSLFLVFILGWLFLLGTLNPETSMLLHVAAAILALFLGVFGWFVYQPKQAPASRAQVDLKEMLMATGVMGIIVGVQTLNANISVILLGAISSAEVAGLFKVSSTAALLGVAGLQAINMVLMPHFARAHRERDQTALQDLATRSARVILATALPLSLVLIVAGRPLLGFAFGAGYTESYTPMVILVIGQLIGASFGSVVTILNMTGHERDTMKFVLLASTINLGLNVLLIPSFSAEGAAYATAGTVVFLNIILHITIRKRLGINSLPIAQNVYQS